ncbi:CLUMA_CG014165, isoform A [Clunio marinus]|uniref:CLUMA_CG014165, isoform A n=1 Tax=Clunio marinus TaxID=568069 RepID=A0A1J1IMC7_9DIPT|nr:CLUMA_CG014165, isoform A [Clunio marinus]
MAGASQFKNEKFIDQYEHIKKLKLLTDEELSQVKRKRSFFEVSIKSCSELRPFIDYIKYEIALMKKFKHIDYENERDGIALDRVLSAHVKSLFRLALMKFQDKRKLWEHFIAFAKQKYFNLVSSIYQEMLCFHRKPEDFIEAAEHEKSRKNYANAMGLLMQGMGVNKEASEKFVALYIECSFEQGSNENDEVKKATLQQASKFYVKILKDSGNFLNICELLNRIQSFDYTMTFQDDIITDLMQNYSEEPEVWNLLAKRHLDGIFYEQNKSESSEVEKETETVPFELCLSRAIEIYEKGLETVSQENDKKMFSHYIEKLLELDEMRNLNKSSLKMIRHSLGKTLVKGYQQDSLSSVHFIHFIKLLMLNIEQNKNEIEEMLEKGGSLYPNSMELFELSIKYFIFMKDHESIKKTFKHAINNNHKHVVEIYRFLCGVYLKSSTEKEKAAEIMSEAINSSDKKLSEAFQPFYLEYHSMTGSIEKTREIFKSLIQTKTSTYLSLDFFRTMIKIEEAQNNPNEKIIKNCYERATQNFGKENSEIWLDYIKFLWKHGKHTEADDLRKRAVEYLKDDLEKFTEFQKQFALLRIGSGMNMEVV